MTKENLLIDNTEEQQFEFHIDSFIPRIEYIKVKDRIFLTHTEVPKALEGKGIGSALVKSVLQNVKAMNLPVVPLCPFVAAYIKRHPEWQALVMKGINV